MAPAAPVIAGKPHKSCASLEPRTKPCGSGFSREEAGAGRHLCLPHILQRHLCR